AGRQGDPVPVDVPGVDGPARGPLELVGILPLERQGRRLSVAPLRLAGVLGDRPAPRGDDAVIVYRPAVAVYLQGVGPRGPALELDQLEVPLAGAGVDDAATGVVELDIEVPLAVEKVPDEHAVGRSSPVPGDDLVPVDVARAVHGEPGRVGGPAAAEGDQR